MHGNYSNPRALFSIQNENDNTTQLCFTVIYILIVMRREIRIEPDGFRTVDVL